MNWLKKLMPLILVNLLAKQVIVVRSKILKLTYTASVKKNRL